LTDLTTPAGRLADAQAKLHLLQTGRLSIKVMVEGREVTYQRTDLDALKGYVSALEDQVANRCSRYGAIGVIF
jgi:polyhydroxyalkanoate synthesis regulator phasin